jgi:hypothetical protein
VSVSSDDGDAERGGPAYPPTNASRPDTSDWQPTLAVRRSKTPWPYQPVRVSLLRFDTSVLPDDAIVTSAELQLYVVSKDSDENRNVVAEWYSSAAWPVDEADWTVADSDTAHRGTQLNEIPTGEQTSFALQNLSSIDSTGATALRMHVSGSEIAPTGPNDLAFVAFDHATLPAPALVVTYEMPG